MSANVNKMELRRAELLTEVAERAASRARDYGVPADVAEQIGCGIADDLADHWGGQIITIPKDYYYRLCRRDREMLEALRAGTSYAELAKRYRMAERSIYRILRRAEVRDRNLRQQRLFEE